MFDVVCLRTKNVSFNAASRESKHRYQLYVNKYYVLVYSVLVYCVQSFHPQFFFHVCALLLLLVLENGKCTT